MQGSRRSLASSPKKKRPTTSNIPSAMEIERSREAMFTEELHNAQMTISEQEIEMERLKTTVIALNAKCAIVDDHIFHADNTTNKHTDSEAKRIDLHSHIKTVTEKLHQDNQDHIEQREVLHSNISGLNASLETKQQEYQANYEIHR